MTASEAVRRAVPEAVQADIVRRYTEQLHASPRIAKDLELEPKRVLRILRRRGVPIRSQAPMDDATRDRIVQLRHEGVLSTWIREETGRSLSVIARACQNPQAEADWLAVWPKIRSNPALLALHREFSPKAKA